jgi:hypothetical protein
LILTLGYIFNFGCDGLPYCFRISRRHHYVIKHYSDPLYSGNKWIYDMINLRTVWEQNITGSGVRVRVNDDGVNVDHTEFVDRYDADASCDNIYPTGSFHGTAVASIVLASANNNECSVGVAPEATLSVCNVFDGRSDAFLADKIDMYDISQNSIGYPACGARRRELEERELQACPFSFEDGTNASPCAVCDFSAATPSPACESAIVFHCQYYYEQDVAGCLQFLELFLPEGGCDYPYLSTVAADSLAQGILDGRSGKGIIYVFASGNSFQLGEDTNLKGFTNSRFIITVGAVGKDGIHTSYSTSGTSLFVAGPGGDLENLSNHITANFEGGCRDAGVGTSFAAPVVSGVIALVLQVNPDLTWRDVQGILAQTSRHVTEDLSDETKVTNDAGFTHSNLVGFGVPDAGAAVEAAKTWELWPAEKMLMGESVILDLIILDDPSETVTTTVTMTPTTEDFVAESVEVYIALQHFSRGDLEVILTSPKGTQSIIHPGQRPENTVLAEDERWKLLTVRSWGESVGGDWTLSIRDISAGDTLECADAPWLVKAGDIDLTCGYVTEQYGFCSNGAVDTSNLSPGQADILLAAEDNGKTLGEACCECGGGIDTSTFEDTLNQWRLVVWGREVVTTETTTESPIVTPVTAPPVAVETAGPRVAPVTTDAPVVNASTTAPTPIMKTSSAVPTSSPTETAGSGSSSSQPSAFPTAAPTASSSLSPTGAATISAVPTSVSARPSPSPSSVSSAPSAIPSASLNPSDVSISPSNVSMSPSESSSPTSTVLSNGPSQLPTSTQPTTQPTIISTPSPTTSATVSPTAAVSAAQQAEEDSGATGMAIRPCLLFMVAAAYLLVF